MPHSPIRTPFPSVWSLIRVVTVSVGLATATIAVGHVKEPLPRDPAPPTGDLSVTVGGNGEFFPNSGGLNPPPGVINTDLDSHCRRSGDPIKIKVPNGRFVGETYSRGDLVPDWKVDTLKNSSAMAAAKTLGETAIITIQHFIWQMGHDCPPPQLKVFLNGRWVKELGNQENHGFLKLPVAKPGTRSEWVTTKIIVPIGALKFPGQLGYNYSSPEPGRRVFPTTNIGERAVNEIKVGWHEPDPPLSCYCLVVDFVTITIQAMAPVVLVHGVNQTDDWWVRHEFAAGLDNQHIPYDGSYSLDKIGAHWYNNSSLNSETIDKSSDAVVTFLSHTFGRWGTSQISLVCHSMGGLHIRDALAHRWQAASRGALTIDPNRRDPFIHVVTLSTPHQGSPLADVQYAHHEKMVGGIRIDRLGDSISTTIANSGYFTDWTPGYACLVVSECTAKSSIIGNDSSRTGLQSRDIAFTFVGADADRNSDRRIDTEEERRGLILDDRRSMLLDTAMYVATGWTAVDRIYQFLQTTSHLTTRTQQGIRLGLQITPDRVYAETVLIPGPVYPGNDLLVQVHSALGLPTLNSLAPTNHIYERFRGRNHSSIGDFQSAATTVSPWLIEKDRISGGMKKR